MQPSGPLIQSWRKGGRRKSPMGPTPIEILDSRLRPTVQVPKVESVTNAHPLRWWKKLPEQYYCQTQLRKLDHTYLKAWSLIFPSVLCRKSVEKLEMLPFHSQKIEAGGDKRIVPKYPGKQSHFFSLCSVESAKFVILWWWAQEHKKFWSKRNDFSL